MDINQYTAVGNNKEIQTNVFIKGMNTDTSDVVLGEDQYRYAENIRIITDTASNTGEARIIEGNKQVIVLGLTGETILATNSIRNIGVFITLKREGEDEDTGWYIYKYDFNNPSTDAEKIFGPCKTSILKEYPKDQDFLSGSASFKKTITTVLRWESDDNIKLYIADGIHELMMISLSNGDLGSDFEEVFGSQNIVLPKLTTKIYNYPGTVDGPVVQYAYRLYEQNGAYTPLSSLTQPLSVYRNASGGMVIGVEPKSKSNSSVQINLDQISVIGPMQYIQIYRIDYAQIGQSPKVSLVYDGQIISQFIDYGTAQQTTITDADLIAMMKLQMIPSVIESKENYLFAGGIKYQQDNIDDQFKDFDARAYNKGMFIEGPGDSKTYIIGDNEPYNFPEIDQQDSINSNQIKENKYRDYTPGDWELIGNTGYNGIGPCFAWKYVETSAATYNSHKDEKYYRRGEVYRFGVRLFDKKGRASSVKWIADIQFPTNETGDYNKFNNVEFIPINTDSEAWQNVGGYEIVQCERTINDRIRLFTGIIGNTNSCYIVDGTDQTSVSGLNTSYEQYVYPNGYVSMMDIIGYGGNIYDIASTENTVSYSMNWYSYDQRYVYQPNTVALIAKFYYSKPSEHIFQFVCPEYIYQKDDVVRMLNDVGKNCTIDINRLLRCGGQRYFPIVNPKLYNNTQYDQGRIAFTAIRCQYMDGLPNKSIYSQVSHLYNTPMSFVSNQNMYTLKDSKGNYLPRHVLAVLYKNHSWDNTDHTKIISNKTQYATNLATVVLNYTPLSTDYTLPGNLPIEILRYKTSDDLYFNVNETQVQAQSEGYIYYTLTDSQPKDYITSDNKIYSETRIPTGDNMQNDEYYHLARYCVKHQISEYNLQFHTASIIDPYFGSQQLSCNKVSKTIDNFAFADALEYNDFGTEDGEDFQFDTKVTAVGGKSFINCTNPYLKTHMLQYAVQSGGDWFLKRAFKEGYGDTGGIKELEPLNPHSDEEHKQTATWARSADTGFGGSCILLCTDDNNPITEHDVIGDNEDLNGEYKTKNMPAVSIADITRSGIIPYGGIKDNNIKQSKYISIGAYTVCDGEYPSTLVTGGDTFFQEFLYCSSHSWYSSAFFVSAQPTILYKVYLETDVNLQGQTSNHLLGRTSWDYRVQEKVSSFGEGLYTQDEDQYTYNTAYGSVADIISYTPNRTTKAQTNNYDTRIHNSQKKTNGELIDSWTTFKTSDFIDVDTQYGPITALKAFKNKLIFWQEEATGVLSVNERSIVQDTNKTHIVLGTGGILDRYDYFTTIFGQKADQHNQTQSDSTLYWWDGNNKEILGYSDGYAISQLSTVKNIKNYINTREERKDPVLIYNKKYGEVICNVVGEEGAVVYSEPVQAFTAVYTYNPVFYLDIKNKLYTVGRNLQENKIYLENSNSQSGISKLFYGQALPKIEYVVNKFPQSTKTFDVQTFGGRFYGGAEKLTTSRRNNKSNIVTIEGEYSNSPMSHLIFSYKTPLKQSSSVSGENVTTTREYDFRLNIPRNGIQNDQTFTNKMQKSWGDRMRGKFIRCTIESTSNDLDFSLQYITTKFRTSWA